MLPRPTLAGLFAALVSCAALLLAACSSSSPQDMNKGTDVALFWVPPDTAPDLPPEVSNETAAEAAPAGANDSASAPDGGTLTDAPVDASIDGEF